MPPKGPRGSLIDDYEPKTSCKHGPSYPPPPDVFALFQSTTGEEPAGRKFQVCAKCKMVKYCSVECQRADWPEHKQVCGKQPEWWGSFKKKKSKGGGGNQQGAATGASQQQA
ncbi:hypothetical protein DFJ74DRAFT_707321 [Hyaloraphidium curvatum]|nr:hypothetical protein DFJ74DRAFT_707321 [Hyaloraphidium curvatum]